MRIVSGHYGGRRILTPKDRSVRPTSDKVRGAIFNSLQSRGILQDSVVIDVFCGTGALGLEALSQGAAFCTFVDVSSALVRQNIDHLGVPSSDVCVLSRSGLKLADRPDSIDAANVVFLDPPYRKNFVHCILPILEKGDWMSKQCFIVCETEKDFMFQESSSFTFIDERLYGDTKVTYVLFS